MLTGFYGFMLSDDCVLFGKADTIAYFHFINNSMYGYNIYGAGWLFIMFSSADAIIENNVFYDIYFPYMDGKPFFEMQSYK